MSNNIISELLNIAKKVFDQHGVFGFIFFVIFLVITYVIIEIFKITIKTKFFQTKVLRKVKCSSDELRKHSVFKTLRDLIDYKVDSIKCECPLRRELFKAILKIRFNTIYKNLMSLTNDNWEISENESRNKWDSFFSRTQHEWVTECYAKGVPRIAIQKYLELTGKVNGIIEETVENICLAPPFAKTNGVIGIFSLIPTMELSAFYALNKTLDTLNGELSKETFNGVSCGDCKVCRKKKV